LRTIEKPKVEILIQLTPTQIQLLRTTAGSVMLRDEISENYPEDLGNLTNKFPGVFMRSYGGAGGLKTLNARGLGSQHFLVVSNQQALLFNQMGSANLGDIQADGLNAVSYSVGGSDSWDLPTLTKTYSGVLHLNYLELNQHLNDKAQFQILSGSFGRYKLSGLWLKNTKNATFFAQAYGYQMRGDFPFEYRHGLVNLTGARLNNTTREASGRFGANVVLNSYNKFQFSTQYLTAQRQLPGAIVFYHPHHFQTLDNNQTNFNAKHEFQREHCQLIHYANYSRTNTDYRDSFHILSPQWQHYQEQNWDIGENGQMKWGNVKLNWSGQYIFSSLSSNRADILLPSRHRALLNLGSEFQHNSLKLRLDFPIQLLSDRLWMSPNQNRFLFTPSLGLNQMFTGKKSRTVLRASLGQFARVATFSEMFYGQMGNPNLRPELSRMINVGFHHKRKISILELNVGIDAFFGQIDDKIIAIPTQNLFVWSVRNVQTVHTYGFDAIASMDYYASNLKLGINYTQKSSLNVAQDISDPNSPTFQHQIPYTPFWMHASELTLKFNKLSLAYQYSFNDFRFVLGENIASNVLDAYHLHDMRIHYELKVKTESKHGFRFHFKINNLFNEQYQVMRGFPMPGRNYEFGLTWMF
jgi:outer membrane receptor for ferrienterochelin and colicin